MQILKFPNARRASQPQTVTLGFLLADYLSFLEARRQALTLAGARSAFNRRLIQRFVDLPAEEITRKMLEDAHRQDLAPIAANRCLEYLRAAWNYGVRRGHVLKDSNPLAHMADFRAPELPRDVILPSGAMPRLLDVIARHRSTAGHAGPFQPDAVLLILLTGMRRGEVEALTWAEVKPGRLELTRSKTGPRMVALCDEAGELLAHRRYRELGGKVFQGIDLRRTWERIRTDADVPGVTLHDLRRSFATALLATGKVDLSDVAKILGHKTTRITAGTYTPLSITRARAIAEIGAAALVGAVDNGALY